MRYIITDRNEFPKCIRHFKELKGICVGCCIDPSYKLTVDTIIRGKKAKTHAHAHSWTRIKDKYQGFICVRYMRTLNNKLTLLHEVAHLIVNKNMTTPLHGERWKKAVVKIGGTYKQYVYVYGSKKLTFPDYTNLYA
jgi:hypothetical protein